MSNFVQVLKACESAGGAGTKNSIAEALASADQIAYRLIWEGLNKYRVYGTKKFDMPAKFADKDWDFKVFFSLLDDLASRTITGNLARSSITTTLGFFTEETANYLARIIAHDLDAGFSADTFNNVLLARELRFEEHPGGSTIEATIKEIKKKLKVKGIRQFANLKVFPLLVPTFEVQLADKPESEEDYAAQEYPCQADIKYDGERNVAIVKLGTPIVHFSRSGIEAEHMQGIFDEELLKMREHLGYDFILDGERAAASFEETMNAKKNGSDKSGMRIRAYFLMPLDHWMAQETDVTMKASREKLGQVLKDLDLKKIILSEGKIVKDHHEMMAYANEVIDDTSRPKSEREGLILKRLNEVYRWERNSAWMKIKRFYPVDLRVIGWYYGKAGSRLAKVMGGVITEGTDENGKKIRTRIGSGFNDQDRANPDSWMNKTIEVKYQEMSQSATAKKAKSDVWQLRFPTIERIRDDKNVQALQDGRFPGVGLEEAVKICGGL